MKAYPASRLYLGFVQFATATTVFAFLDACSLLQPSEPRIIAIGDLHGDYNAFENVMTRAGLMNEGGNWAGGNMHPMRH